MAKTDRPQRIQNYAVIRDISSGSSSYVYLVSAKSRQYALKLLKTADEATIVRFRKESATLARLSHASLVKIHDIGDHDGRPFIVMDYLQGQTLEDLIKHKGTVSGLMAVSFTVSVASALAELHRNNLIHRDIKPANIFITSDNKAKLIDLGLIGDMQEVQKENGVVGTPMFCAPEQSRILKRDVDFRSDLYSLGVTLFAVLTGRTPFIGTVNEILLHHASTPAPDPRELNSSVTPALAAIVTRLLAKDPDDRYQSAVGLIYDLEHLPTIEERLQRSQNPGLGAGDRATLTSKVKFVERVDERDALNSAWEKIGRGGGGLVIVSGPSGSGKTRLCDEFVEQLNLPNLFILRCKCQLLSLHLPFAPIREAIDSLLENIEHLPEIPKQQALQELKQAALGHEADLLKLSKSFRRILSADIFASSKEQGNLEGDREAFFDSLSSFFTSLFEARVRTLFFVDDVQWLDQASLQLLQAILSKSEKKPVLLLGTARDDAESKQYLFKVEEALADHLIDTVTVGPFGLEQTRALIGKYLGEKFLGSEISAPIYRASKGNPFIVIEYLRAGIEQGFLRYQDDAWRIDEIGLEKIALSDNVFELIIRRIESSTANVKEFLQRAALYGSTFRPTDILASSAITADEVPELLRQAQGLGLIEKVSAAKWRFIHDKISESLIASLPPERLRLVCAELASGLFAKSERTSDDIFTTARLFTRAESELHLRDAVQANAEAGELAIANYAYDEAYGFYWFAYQRLGNEGADLLTKVRFALNLAVCATMVGNDHLAVEAVDIYIEHVGSETEQAHGYALKVWILTSQSAIVSAWEHFKHTCNRIGVPYPKYQHWKLLQTLSYWALTIVLDLLPVRVPTRFFFRLRDVDVNKISNMHREAQVLCELRGNSLDFILVTFRLLVMGQLVGGVKERAMGYACAGYLYGSFGLKRLAEAYFEKAEVCCKKINDPSITALYKMRRLFGQYYSGMIKDYRDGYEEDRELFNRYLSPTELGRFLLHIAYFYGFRGLHTESIQLLSKLIDDAEKKKIRVPKHQVTVAMNQLWFQLSLVGRSQDSQRVKAIALARNNELRYTPPMHRSPMTSEILYRRVTEELSITTDEIVNCFWKRGGSRLADPPLNNIAANLAFIRLFQFEKAVSFEEKFSTRRELNAMLRHMYLTLYCPLFRANYHVIQAGYARVLRRFRSAERSLRRAEELAGRFGGLRVLFDVNRTRARMQISNDTTELAKISVSSAAAIAHANGWRTSIEILRSEFLKRFDIPSAGATSSVKNGSGAETIHNDASATRQVDRSQSTNASRVPAKKVSSLHTKATEAFSSTFADQIGLQGERFVNALMSVSSSFITSLNPVHQANAVLSSVIQLFAAERGFIFSMDEGAGALRVAAGQDKNGQDLSQLSGYASTVVKKAFAEKIPIIVAGTDEAEALGSESAVLYNLRSIMATPLMVKEAVIGVVYLDSSLTRGLFTENDIALFSNLASHIAISFELGRMAQVEIEKANLQKELDVQAAVAAESKKVKVLVDNMQQALFSIDSKGTVVEPVSRYSQTVFGRDVSGKNIFNVLYGNLESEQEKSALIRSTLETVFGEDEIQWSVMEDNLPKRIVLLPDARAPLQLPAQVLKIQASPIWNQEERLEQLLFVIEDVTSLEALEHQIAEQRAQAEMLESIVGSGRAALAGYLSYWDRCKLSCVDFAEAANPVSSVEEILRGLHTLKGNARFYRLSRISGQIHQSETELEKFKGHYKDAEPLTELLHTLARETRKIDAEMEVFRTLFRKVFPDQEAIHGDSVNSAALEELKQLVDSLATTLDPANAAKLRTAIEQLSHKSVREAVLSYRSMIQDVSLQLNKQIEFKVEGEGLLPKYVLELLSEALLHLIRNSIDHGIEASSDRIALQKAEKGQITVKISQTSGVIDIIIADDGRGIDHVLVAHKAVTKGLRTEAEVNHLSVEEKVRLIFLPSFSTKEVVSEIAGRGVGMDIVLKNVEQLGGRIEVQSVIGQGTQFFIQLESSATIPMQSRVS